MVFAPTGARATLVQTAVFWDAQRTTTATTAKSVRLRTCRTFQGTVTSTSRSRGALMITGVVARAHVTDASTGTTCSCTLTRACGAATAAIRKGLSVDTAESHW